MRDRLYGVLPRRVVLMAVPMLAACALGTSQSGAATPHPVRAGSIKVVKRAVVQPAPLKLADLEAILGTFTRQPVTISCDTLGVPSPIDGNTMDADADGEVFWSPVDDSPRVILPTIHVWAFECTQALSANRRHDPAPTAWSEFAGHRVDDLAGSPLAVMLHEAMHIALQSNDEGLVECTAYRNDWALVRQLHLSALDAGMVFQGMRARHFDFLPTDPAEAAYRAVC